MKKFLSVFICAVLIVCAAFPAFAASQIPEKPYDNSNFYTMGDYTVHYRVLPSTGESKGRVLLIHGFTASTETWMPVAERLASDGFSCVLADLPNHGYTTRENDQVQEIEREELMVGLMQSIAPLSEWSVAGHSMGGAVALNIAVAHPEIKSLILCCPANLSGGIFDLMAKAPTQVFGSLCDSIIKLMSGSPLLVRAALWAASANLTYAKNFEIGKILDPLAVEGTGMGIAYMLKRAQAVDTNAIGKLKMPILLIYGDSDNVVFGKMEREIADALPQAKRYTVSGGGHLLLETHADITESLMKDYI